MSRGWDLIAAIEMGENLTYVMQKIKKICGKNLTNHIKDI